MNNPSSNDKALNETLNPNDDGFVIGTAGRDEDPNATTDWDVSRDNEDVMTPDDTRGLPGYPGAEENNPSKPVPDSSVPANGDPSVQNDSAD
ncbi:hypothetical protein EVS84_25945 [Pseudomonas koreensis]|uniref:Uncharacterized protein n=2 Tax=Pseudomonas TaxID=286 RepID=A0A4Q4KVP7_9PSED|nr:MULTISPECIES: hypothetical protein [Pseudomonas]WKV86615.1 hypothetical protein LJJ44_13115 [Pseudomonas sp. B24_DOA]WKV88041.1 hypothetical protein LJU32_21155 [Pseudomonas sp. B21_DOA]KIF56586.1 hypothetical protein NX10_22730 [Pseudomonas fluorescens]MDM8194402.1 hypothetical protein [Pseudomonas fluorescens]MDP8575647.1 hypothetical protein [Pseudomonas iranensis]